MIIWGSITTWWDESRLFVSNILQTCVIPQGGLWPCWIHTLMTLWLGLFPMCADQVKNRQQCREVELENTIKSMHLILFSPLVLREFNRRNFPICYSVFYNYLSSCLLSWPHYLRCNVSCPLNFDCRYVVLFTILPSVPSFLPTCIIF